MQKVAQKIFYASLFRFQFFLFIAIILPLLAIKLLLRLYPTHIESVLSILIIVSLGLAIIGSCIYVLFHYVSLDKTLAPVTRMAEVGELAARVAHDLRGPLSGIKAVFEYLSPLEKKDADFTKHLNLLELASRRLENVAKDLLQKHRGEEEETISFNLHEVLDELAGEYASQSLLAGVRFQKKYANCPIFVTGRRRKIQRMFGNIIKNAIEAMDFEGVIILTTDVEKNRAEIGIGDTGPGLSPEKIEKIMGGAFTEGKKDGHGIGLTFVKEVLAEHAGSLEIESAVGDGCRFRLTLPLGEETPSSFEMDVADGVILVVDDDPSILEQWNLKLAAAGQRAILASRYEECAGKDFASEKCQTAIVDYHFDNSELNGIEIVAKLREQGFKNLYLCTAEYWKPLLKKQAEEMGVAICPKPLPEIKLRTMDNGPRTMDQQRGGRGYTVLVIDDDESIRLSWEVIQNKLHIEQLFVFPNLEALLEAPIDLKQIDIAFVDKNIRDSQHSGGAVVDYLKARGVAKVVLASGENETELRKDPAFAQADFISGDKIPGSFKEFFS